jgi:hypothetical protein
MYVVPHAGETDFATNRDRYTKDYLRQFLFRYFYIENLRYTCQTLGCVSIGIDGTEHANALVIDDSSNVYFTGSIRDTVDFSEDSSIVILIAGSQRDSLCCKT